MVLQLQMLLPLLMEEPGALQKCISVFRKGQSIGDGIGSLVVARLMVHNQKQVIAQETVYSETQYANRKLCLLKAPDLLLRLESSVMRLKACQDRRNENEDDNNGRCDSQT